MLGTLATVKDILLWIMVVLAAALIECARREYMRAEHVRRQTAMTMGGGIDFGGPSQGVNVDLQTKNMATFELNAISGPKLVYREEEEARRKREEDERKQWEEEERRRKKPDVSVRPLPTLLQSQPQPLGPGAPGNKDNYYGNGMGLKRSGTLNYMYESRVAEPAAAPTVGPILSAPSGPKRPLAPIQEVPGAPGNKDNYYGNGMGLKRSGTVNYESRV